MLFYRSCSPGTDRSPAGVMAVCLPTITDLYSYGTVMSEEFLVRLMTHKVFFYDALLGYVVLLPFVKL